MDESRPIAADDSPSSPWETPRIFPYYPPPGPQITDIADPVALDGKDRGPAADIIGVIAEAVDRVLASKATAGLGEALNDGLRGILKQYANNPPCACDVLTKGDKPPARMCIYCQRFFEASTLYAKLEAEQTERANAFMKIAVAALRPLKNQGSAANTSGGEVPEPEESKETPGEHAARLCGEFHSNNGRR